MLQKLIYSILFFCLQNFIIFKFFLFIELFLDQPTMVLRYPILDPHNQIGVCLRRENILGTLTLCEGQFTI